VLLDGLVAYMAMKGSACKVLVGNLEGKKSLGKPRCRQEDSVKTNLKDGVTGIRIILNVAIVWDIMPCSPHVNQHFGETYHFHVQGKKSAKQEGPGVCGKQEDCKRASFRRQVYFSLTSPLVCYLSPSHTCFL
jgi:hypothetical protein